MIFNFITYKMDMNYIVEERLKDHKANVLT